MLTNKTYECITRKQIKEYQKVLRKKMIAIMDSNPEWCHLPADDPDVNQVREIQKKIEFLGKIRPYRE